MVCFGGPRPASTRTSTSCAGWPSWAGDSSFQVSSRLRRAYTRCMSEGPTIEMPSERCAPCEQAMLAVPIPRLALMPGSHQLGNGVNPWGMPL